MSYCRWSSAEWKSDLYVYEDVSGGWTIHVAANRVVGDVPALIYEREKLAETYAAQMDFLKTAKREAIDLPHAGESYNLPTPGDCADTCERLAAIGFFVPRGVIATLRQEQRELDATHD